MMLHKHGARPGLTGGVAPRVVVLPRPVAPAFGLARDILTQQTHIEGDPISFLTVTEAYWKALRNQKHEPEKKGPTVVRVANKATTLGPLDYDVVVCGGTLGLMVGATLARRGHRVAVVDKRLIQGRTQEWNISRGELESLLSVGLLTKEELEGCIATQFNPMRCGFAGGEDIWVNDVLNLGVSPRRLLDLIKQKFVEAGGTLLEHHSFRAADVVPGEGVRLTLTVHPPGTSGAALDVGDVNRPNGLGGNSSNFAPPFTPVNSTGHTPTPTRVGRRKMELNCALLLDCMGHYSDIVKQMRGKAKPDGMVLVVGSCAEGYPAATNTYGDVLYTVDHARDDMQVFWEAFPAEGGAARTTYMFAYSDAEPSRPDFETLLDRYFEELQDYQGVPASALKFKRVLFGGFPCWKDGPLKPQWDHVMQIGDASATQSPLSFGGFGAMLRHLPRLTEGLDDALRCGALTRDELACLHPYQPALNASWLFQRSMSVGVGSLARAEEEEARAAGLPVPQRTVPASPVQLPRSHVNEVLACNFGVMKVLGDRVLRPFLQDTIQLGPLAVSMTGMGLSNPVAISRVLLQVGPNNVLSWFVHFAGLVTYTLLHAATTPVRDAVRSTAAQSLTQPGGVGVPVVSTSEGRSRAMFRLRRAFDAWEYGSGSDYTYHKPDGPAEAPHFLRADARPASPRPASVEPAEPQPTIPSRMPAEAVPVAVPVVTNARQV